MNKVFSTAAFAAFATLSFAPAAAQARDEVSVSSTAVIPAAATVEAGKSLYSANGSRIGAIYKVTQNGQAQLILDGKLVSIPVASLTEVDGKITTALTKRDLKKR